MEQKFVNFEEALEKLGISADRLNALREEGQLRAYRDGKSWKFRADEIEKMQEHGVPEPEPPSDIGLVEDDQLVAAGPIDTDDKDEDLELELASEEPEDSEKPEESELKLAPEPAEGRPQAEEKDSALESEGLDDTVTASGSDIRLAESHDEDEDLDPSDSILLSEEELGESVSASHSTIIGKGKETGQDADLELASDDDQEDVSSGTGASDVLSSGVAGSGVLDTQSSGGMSAFEDIDELEIDLAAESSKALAPEDLEDAKAAKAKEKQDTAASTSDVSLDEDLQLSEDDSNMGSTDVPILEPEAEQSGEEETAGSEIELATDDDLILSDSSGSDITLDSGDSGINLGSPSDSGLALDDIPLEMGGSAILSSLSLEGSDPEISLLGEESKKEGEAELQTDDDFQLTPLSEGGEEDEDSSSQVIALDADVADLGAEEAAEGSGLGGLSDMGLSEEADEGVVFSEDFAEEPAGDLGYATTPAATAEPGYSVLNIIGLGSCALLLMLCGIMLMDMVFNIWSWDETYTLNSTLIDAILGIFGN